jgi:hypothetical protein
MLLLHLRNPRSLEPTLHQPPSPSGRKIYLRHSTNVEYYLGAIFRRRSELTSGVLIGSGDRILSEVGFHFRPEFKD